MPLPVIGIKGIIRRTWYSETAVAVKRESAVVGDVFLLVVDRYCLVEGLLLFLRVVIMLA